MNDDQVVPAQDPNAKNPLDALEEILQQAKAKQGNSQEEEEAEKKRLEEEKQREFERLEAEQREKDAQQLKAQIADLQSVTEMPAYKARVQQAEEAKQEKQQHDDAEDGYEIVQIKHDKL